MPSYGEVRSESSLRLEIWRNQENSAMRRQPGAILQREIKDRFKRFKTAIMGNSLCVNSSLPRPRNGICETATTERADCLATASPFSVLLPGDASVTDMPAREYRSTCSDRGSCSEWLRPGTESRR